MASAPTKLLRRLKTQAPITSAKKKSLRSAPRIVRGRFRVRYTGFRSVIMIGAAFNSEQPAKKIDGQDGHANAENDSGERAFTTTFAESEGESAYDDGDERQTLSDRTSERRL